MKANKITDATERLATALSFLLDQLELGQDRAILDSHIEGVLFASLNEVSNISKAIDEQNGIETLRELSKLAIPEPVEPTPKMIDEREVHSFIDALALLVEDDMGVDLSSHGSTDFWNQDRKTITKYLTHIWRVNESVEFENNEVAKG